ESYAFSDLLFELDGVSVPNLDGFYVSSPLFDFTVPPNNVFDISPPGPCQAVAAGISVIIEPLSIGTHRLHFRARSGNSGFADVTYLITVFTWPTITIRPLPDARLAVLSWYSAVNFSLQESTHLSPSAAWAPASLISAESTNGTHSVRVTAPSSNRF